MERSCKDLERNFKVRKIKRLSFIWFYTYHFVLMEYDSHIKLNESHSTVTLITDTNWIL